MNLRQQLEDFEGRRHRAYPDPLTNGAPWTIGVGHTGPEVHEGLVWTDEQIDAALTLDIAEAERGCQLHFPWFAALNEPRQAVLIGMCFQMGIGYDTPAPGKGVLAFRQTLGAIRDERFEHAAECMRQSAWAHQTPKRAVRMAAQMASGTWQ